MNKPIMYPEKPKYRRLVDLTEIRKGDQLAQPGLLSIYTHHLLAAEDGVPGKTLCVVHLNGNVALYSGSIFGKVMEENIDVNLQKQIFYRVEYNSVKVFSPEKVLKRAREKIGIGCYSAVFFNCEHFATWCKTGQYVCFQLSDCLLRKAFAIFIDCILKPKQFIGHLSKTIFKLIADGIESFIIFMIEVITSQSTWKILATRQLTAKGAERLSASSLGTTAGVTFVVTAVPEIVIYFNETAELCNQLQEGIIDDEQYTEEMHQKTVGSMGAIVGSVTGAMVGQAIVPVPVLGAVVGGATGTLTRKFIGRFIGRLLFLWNVMLWIVQAICLLTENSLSFHC
ncbi:uncharacterized protein LOC102806083 [Saccoglossus kowalevskii]|uniref:Uncharacterized protein LOC102806083 n=1 Tax=Saccoglossus kowalevskii TaxID=10224 RepID=A0ABM0N170_SACKO|nr:PREDICTED: uncharacterized protein LOC102806083 [Saccoglossus kowalevskii]